MAATIQIKGKKTCKWNGTLKAVSKNKSINCICVFDIDLLNNSINSNKLITKIIKETIIPTQKKYLLEIYKPTVEKIDNFDANN